MKQWVQKSIVFMGKSMLWSLLFYIVLMLAFNWQDVSSAVNGKNKTTIVNSPQPDIQQPDPPKASPNIANRAGIITTVITLVKTISWTGSLYH